MLKKEVKSSFGVSFLQRTHAYTLDLNPLIVVDYCAIMPQPWPHRLFKFGQFVGHFQYVAVINATLRTELPFGRYHQMNNAVVDLLVARCGFLRAIPLSVPLWRCVE